MKVEIAGEEEDLAILDVVVHLTMRQIPSKDYLEEFKIQSEFLHSYCIVWTPLSLSTTDPIFMIQKCFSLTF